jgi:DNA-binding NtrC family response regulator
MNMNDASRSVLLVVDDEPQLRKAVRRILLDTKLVVLDAESAAEALRIASSCTHPIDILLTDVNMPGMSGKALAAHLQRAHSQLQVAFMSAAEQPPSSSMRAPFLRKPFSAAQLLDTLRSLAEQ